MNTPNTPKLRLKAAVYLRISNDKTGEHLGVTRQREDCVALCQVKGWTPVEYMDNDISAASGKRRPAYERMLTDIEDGQLGAVVVWDLDRLHRRPIELEKFMETADTHRIALASVNGDVDLATEQGRFFARMKGTVAAYEIEHMKARQRRQHQQKAEQGQPHWRRAFGYLGDTYQPDPKTAPLVAEAYAAVLAGGSLADVARLFNTAGATRAAGKPWTAPQVGAFLRKPRNAGLRSYRGEVVRPGNWPALVSEDTWRAVCTVLDGRPGRPAGRKPVRQHLLTGALYCGKCGHYLTGHYTNTGVITYACTACRGVSIRAEHVEPIVLQLVAGRLAMPDAVDLLKKEIHDCQEAEKLRLAENTLLVRLDEIAAERADGLIDGTGYAKMVDRIRGQLDGLRRRQHDVERLRLFADLPLGKPEVAAKVRRLSRDRFRAVLDVLATITVAPVGKGGRVFHPERVQVSWR